MRAMAADIPTFVAVVQGVRLSMGAAAHFVAARFFEGRDYSRVWHRARHYQVSPQEVRTFLCSTIHSRNTASGNLTGLAFPSAYGGR